MNQNNRITPLSNNLDNNYDENFHILDINFKEEIFANMLENLILDSETILPEIETTLNNTLNEKNPIKYVISEEEVNKLKTIKFKDVLCKHENNICSITQEPFTDSDEIIQLPCNHCFQKDAILNWLTKEKGECPVCRNEFECIEMKVENTSSQENNNNNQTESEGNEFTSYDDHFFILPSYLRNEPRPQYNNRAYFDFFRTEPPNNEENS